MDFINCTTYCPENESKYCLDGKYEASYRDDSFLQINGHYNTTMESWQINGKKMTYFNWAKNQPDLKNHITIGRNSYDHKVFYRYGFRIYIRLRVKDKSHYIAERCK